MDPVQYNKLTRFLRDGKLLFEKQSGKQKKKFLAIARHFVWESEELQRKTGKRKVKVLQNFQVILLLQVLHDSLTAGHAGVSKIFQVVQQRYYWPQMFEDIRNYVKTCDDCQQREGLQKNNIIHPIPAKAPFQRIGIDIVGPLTITRRGNRYIVTAMDYFTKWPIAKALKEAMAKAVSKFIYQKIICEHGCSEVLQSDQGTHFVNRVIEDLTEKFRIKYRLSSPYHSQMNGLVERFNQTLCEKLAKLLEETDQWDEFVDPVLMAYRTTKHSATGVTPFLLTYGREVVLPIDETKPLTIHERMMSIVKEIPHIREEARLMIQKAQDRMSQRTPEKEIKFIVGEEVLCRDSAKESWYSGKLEPKWKGPYQIAAVLLNGSYKIADQEGVLRTPVNEDRLKPYNQRSLELIIIVENI